MPLTAGTKLGPYEIHAAIGSGGMGEVYRARDPRLDREVAIKVLHEEFTRDRERLARFEREAKLLASLNHPAIATLHGLEESEGTRFLVMELVEAETLADRIARGPLPVPEAVELFIQIAEGLASAHGKGIIHRDLKPANIKMTPDGRVKILDFGLAKAFAGEADDVSAETSQSPTLTRGTSLGAIMGTASYMSPEQARGKRVDPRTDVWAFGCCLYEALTARKAFDGETVTDILASVVQKEPAWEKLPASLPSSLTRLLRRALQKDPRERLHDITDARLELKDALVDEPALSASRPRARTSLYAMALIILAVLGVALWSLTRTRSTEVKPVARFTLPLPPGQDLVVSGAGPAIAISPDGRQFAWIALREAATVVYLRAADELDARPLEGTEGAEDVFFSPDGRWLGFSTLERLMKVPVTGGAPVAVANLYYARGATFVSDGNIVLSTEDALYQVPLDGGDAVVLARPDRDRREKSLRFPDVLPGRRTVIFTSGSADMETWDEGKIQALSLETGEVRTLIEGGTNGRYSPTGHLLYTRGSRLFAVPFDAAKLEVKGAPVPVLESISTYPINGTAQFAISGKGSLLYAAGEVRDNAHRVVLVSRDGEVEPLIDTPRPFELPRFRPDGELLAVSINAANVSLWVYDLRRGTLTRLVSGFNNMQPVWSPKGDAIVFGSDARGKGELFRMAADGSAEAESLAAPAGAAYPESWSPDGKFLLYSESRPDTLNDLVVLSLDEDRTARDFLGTKANEYNARFSRDGRWVAYQSDESGRAEIYLRSFRDPGPKWQVSTGGGTDPLWNPQGGELFYRNGDKMMAVDIELGAVPRLAKPRVLFEKHLYNTGGPDYDVTPDGQRFVMIDESIAAPRPTELVLVQNFAEELKRRVPADR